MDHEHPRKEIRYCPDTKTFTFAETCRDGTPSQNVRPAKYSPQDAYGKYRRMARKRGIDNDTNQTHEGTGDS